MARTGSRLQHWWDRVRSKDPYWDDFVNRPPADPRNIITDAIVAAEQGSVYGQQTEIHDPAAMSGHIKELAKYFGADLVGIAGLTRDLTPSPFPSNEGEAEEEFRFAIVCVVGGEYDPQQAKGIGGQVALQKSAVVNFNVGAYIRELGFAATVSTACAHELAEAAGLGKLDERGRLVTSKYGNRVGVAGVVLTNLLLVPDRGTL